METNEYDIFISYSRKDFQMAKKMKKDIEKNTGAVCWMDMEGIESGAQFEDIIVTAIDKSEMVLFLLSENSMQSKWVKDEIRYAYETGKKVVPANIDGCTPTGWFLFKFGGRDVIDCSNEIQRNKMMENIRLWFSKGNEAPTTPQNTQTTPPSIEPTTPSLWEKILKNPNAKKGGMVVAVLAVCIGVGAMLMPSGNDTNNVPSEIEGQEVVDTPIVTPNIDEEVKDEQPNESTEKDDAAENTDEGQKVNDNTENQVVSNTTQSTKAEINPIPKPQPKPHPVTPKVTTGTVTLSKIPATYKGQLEDGKPKGEGVITFTDDYTYNDKEYFAGQTLSGAALDNGKFQSGTTNLPIR